MIDFFGSDAKLEAKKTMLKNKFNYLSGKGEFETRLLGVMEAETERIIKERDAKKKRQ